MSGQFIAMKNIDVLGSKLLVPKKTHVCKGIRSWESCLLPGFMKVLNFWLFNASWRQNTIVFQTNHNMCCWRFRVFVGCGYKHCRDGRETPQNNNSQKSTPRSTEPRRAFSSCRLISLEQSRSISSKMSSPVRTLQSAKHGGTQRHVGNATTVFRPWGSASDFLVSSSAS